MSDLSGSLSVQDSALTPIPEERNPFPSLLSEFIYVRTYSRWMDDVGRRETWPETVDRYIDFLVANRPGIPRHVIREVKEGILNLEVLPSMRALWAAGEAASRDNTCFYNCFGGGEKFVTPKGLLSLRDAEGQDVVVRTVDGEWRPATVQYFGQQPTFDVVLGHWTGRKHGNVTHTVRVTADHRWLLLDGTETTALKVGDKLAAPNLVVPEQDGDDEAVRHGFVFGDGTITRTGNYKHVQVRLCGKKAHLLDTLFQGFGHSFPPSYGGDPVVYCGPENTHWKRLPDTKDPNYIAGFLRGLFLADGCGTGTSGNLRLSSQDASLVEWVRENAPLAGYKFLSDQVYENPTNFGERGAPLHLFLLGTGNSAVFRVESIVPVGIEDVYCVVEPVTRTFTLASGQVTGNCSFCPLDSIPSFAELLYILMMGTGAGFSVERVFVNNLPVVASLTGEVVPYVIEDSTEGWADSLKFGLTQWFKGHSVEFDFSKLRARGAPLKTKGGRASGPEPLQRLLALCEKVLHAATGRKLRPIECHDIACAIGDIVHVGGFRRAALISFSDPDDEEMRHAKDWSRGEFPSIRYMANNSAFYAERPTEEKFWKEWGALVASRSGERGFFRMPPAKRATRRGDYRCNPCVSARTWVQTTEGPRQVSELIGKPFTAIVDGFEYPSTEEGFWCTGAKSLHRLSTAEGYHLELTDDHRVMHLVDGEWAWAPAKDVKPGSLIRLNDHRRPVIPHNDDSNQGRVVGATMTDITSDIEGNSDSFVVGFLEGLFDTHGRSVFGIENRAVRLLHLGLPTLEAVQRMLLRFGVGSYIQSEGTKHELCIGDADLHMFTEVVRMSDPTQVPYIKAHLGMLRESGCPMTRECFAAQVVGLTPLGEEDVYDCSIPGLNAFDANGLYVHNCGEISLRFTPAVDPWTGEGGSGSFCNLSAGVMRADDTKETMARKVRLATWIGVIQATFTYFPYLRPGWQKICEEDRLLGVDITGQCDNPGLSDNIETMTYLNQVARETAAEAAAIMDINMPAAITCGKPSGNTSQLVDCASGFHPRYARYYVRRVRIDGKDPLTALLRDSGVPMHKENGMGHLPDDEVPVWVVEFPVKAPAKAMVRDSETALEMCNRYLRIMQSWCGERGHNQSATIYVRDHEWEEVGQWVWDHFDEITGLAFLPHDGGSYKLAPYEEITEEQYEAAMALMPEVDFSLLTAYEEEDRGKGSQELACLSGACEI